MRSLQYFCILYIVYKQDIIASKKFNKNQFKLYKLKLDNPLKFQGYCDIS